MRNIFLLTANILKVTFRKKSSFIVYFVLPLLGLFISMAMHSSTGTRSLNVGIINKDNGIFSDDMIDSLRYIEDFDLTHTEPNSFENLLLDDRLVCVVIFPADYTESFLSGKPAKIEIVTLKGKDTTIWLENYIRLYAENVYILVQASGGRKEVFDKLYQGYKEQKLNLEAERVVYQAKDRSIAFHSLGFLFMFVMIGTGNTAEIILKEKRDRTYFRICSAPVKPGEYVLSNAVTNIIIVLVQICALIFVMRWVFKINTYVADWQMLVILGYFGLIAVAIGMVIVAFAGSSYEAGAASTLVIVPTCMLGGCFWPAELMPDMMQKASYFVPQRWALDAIQALQRGADFSDVVGNLAVLLAFAAALFAISAYRFRVADNLGRFV